MTKIKIGEFVRTKDGKIGIFDRYSSRPDNSLYKCPADCFIRLKGRKTPLQCYRDYIAKHSEDIKKLIEIGDFVNGSMVYEILEDGRIHIMTGHLLNSEDIKTILTHEQFTKNVYEVEE